MEPLKSLVPCFGPEAKEEKIAMYVNPYENARSGNGEWMKACFHIHAGTEADPYDIEDVIRAYMQAGYKIMTISNQNILTDTSGYADTYGITLFNGIEYMEQEEMLCVGIQNFPRGDVKSVASQCAAEGGFAIACHPNYSRRGWWPPEKMAAVKEIIGLEIMNPVIYRVEGCGLATDCWDKVLSKGRLIWGFANDDFHQWSDFARAFTLIHSRSQRYDDVKEAVLNGRFYASTGLVLGQETLEKDTIHISLNCGKIDFGEIIISFIGEEGSILKKCIGIHGEYRLSGSEKYVRVHVMAESGSQLWTQPIYSDRYYKPPVPCI
jgi:hypothetical protein